ncbi:MAG: HIRAN domain-containing protein [Bacteroidales bacterium]|nr:HIRAN domain-containing protein [Bacteroidales bacterium]MBR6863281.1 HIRAN domain-containing protein [Bacteroidales bacterium]
MKTRDNKSMKKVHLTNFHIAGFGYWDGCEAFEHLRIGTSLEFVREADNPFDPYAVAIYYGDYKLGFIPRGSNHDISKYLDMGLDDIYDVRITRISPDTHPENQIEVIVKIKNQNESKIPARRSI